MKQREMCCFQAGIDCNEAAKQRGLPSVLTGILYKIAAKQRSSKAAKQRSSGGCLHFGLASYIRLQRSNEAARGVLCSGWHRLIGVLFSAWHRLQRSSEVAEGAFSSDGFWMQRCSDATLQQGSQFRHLSSHYYPHIQMLHSANISEVGRILWNLWK